MRYWLATKLAQLGNRLFGSRDPEVLRGDDAFEVTPELIAGMSNDELDRVDKLASGMTDAGLSQEWAAREAYAHVLRSRND